MHEDIKSWLSTYSDQTRHVDLLIERATVLEEQINSPRAAQLDGMPHGNGRTSDPIGNALARLEALQQQIDDAREVEAQLYRERDTAISRITGKRWAEWRAVLQMRYLDGMTWEGITLAMYGSRDDYDDKAESYLRSTYRHHKDALAELAKINPLEAGEMRNNT